MIVCGARHHSTLAMFLACYTFTSRYCQKQPSCVLAACQQPHDMRLDYLVFDNPLTYNRVPSSLLSRVLCVRDEL